MDNSQSSLARPTQTPPIMTSPSKIIVIHPVGTTQEDDADPDSPCPEPAVAEASYIRGSSGSSKTDIIFECGEDYREEELQSSIRKMYTNMKAQQEQAARSGVGDIQIHEEEEGRSFSSEEEDRSFSSEEEDRSFCLEESDFRKGGQRSHLAANRPADLVLQPILQHKMVRCVLKKSGGVLSLSQSYELHLVEERKLVLLARKSAVGLRSMIQMFVVERGREEKVGAVKSNYTRTEYKLTLHQAQSSLSHSQLLTSSAFSSSILKLNPLTLDSQTATPTHQQCYLSFESNLLGIRQQQMSVIRPKKRIVRSERFSDLKTAWENGEYERLERFSSRPALKNKEGQLALDFKQPHILSSSKNMMLESDYGEVAVVLAKRADDLFLLNLMAPFSLLQGFFIAVCAVDSKPLVR